MEEAFQLGGLWARDFKTNVCSSQYFIKNISKNTEKLKECEHPHPHLLEPTTNILLHQLHFFFFFFLTGSFSQGSFERGSSCGYSSTFPQDAVGRGLGGEEGV